MRNIGAGRDIHLHTFPYAMHTTLKQRRVSDFSPGGGMEVNIKSDLLFVRCANRCTDPY